MNTKVEAKEEAHFCWQYDNTKVYCKSLLQEKPNSVHCRMAKAISKILGREFSRNSAKSLKYGATYGATALRVSKIIGDTIYVGQKVYNTFWEEAKPLAILKDRLVDYWKTAGDRKYVLGLDGRRIPSRSEHSILNFVFQSAGVICAKKAMVIHDKMLKAEGMLVDFFKDTVEPNRIYAQQLIAYHK